MKFEICLKRVKSDDVSKRFKDHSLSQQACAGVEVDRLTITKLEIKKPCPFSQNKGKQIMKQN